MFQLDDRKTVFPPPHLADSDGLLAAGGDLSPERLLCAYANGIFPWYADGAPILWWSPDPRMVLFPDEFHLSRRLGRRLKADVFKVDVDTAFRQVVEGCRTARGPHRDGTWITPEMLDAYTRLHEIGYAHSFESWREGKLAGGLYGVSLGGCFFGESMFSAEPDASKVALCALVDCARSMNLVFIDCQVANDHLRRLGAREIPRARFLKLLGKAIERPTREGSWKDLALQEGRKRAGLPI